MTSDTVLINGKGYKQKSGLAMGNNIAPILAIIYMNELDKLIIDSCEGSLFLRRLNDDIFIAWTSNSMDLSPFRQNFEKYRNRQKYHHILKEHPTFTKIARFGCEML